MIDHRPNGLELPKRLQNPDQNAYDNCCPDDTAKASQQAVPQGEFPIALLSGLPFDHFREMLYCLNQFLRFGTGFRHRIYLVGKSTRSNAIEKQNSRERSASVQKNTPRLHSSPRNLFIDCVRASKNRLLQVKR